MRWRGADTLTAHSSQIVNKLASLPSVIGHSFGGVISQKLLANRHVAAAIAIAPRTDPRGSRAETRERLTQPM
jgi:alpha/beta superfamily hydrolase